jgi:hypothetical protein
MLHEASLFSARSCLRAPAKARVPKGRTRRLPFELDAMAEARNFDVLGALLW